MKSVFQICWIISLTSLLGLAPCFAQTIETSPKSEKPTIEFDFNRDIKPLLSQRCFLCHGPDESSREAGLRLDTPEGATEDLGGYAAVVPGDLEASELIRRIHSDDESDVMPPPESGEPLSPREKKLLSAWIKAGGKYEKHWSYVAPRRPNIPDPTNSPHAAWPNSDLDRLVLAKMQEHKLTPSQPADRLTLARRLSLDLTGLPPSVERADAFATDTRPNAYELYVDELLASDAYAEHWAAAWLDLARYADSAGYAEDRKRQIWAYRDYVIRSYQANQSFEDFTIEQIAGDLLPSPGTDALIATAFHRNTLTNSEGGTSDEEFRSAAVVDRTNTTMAVWMGTTMACAQCHTHKYDPITQEEYFQVYAILNNTADNDRANEAPVFGVFDQKTKAQRQQLESQVANLQSQLKTLETQPAEAKQQRLKTEQLDWERGVKQSIDQKIKGVSVRIRLQGQRQILQLAEVQIFSGDTNIAVDGKAKQSSTYAGGAARQAINDNTDGTFDNQNVSHTNPQRDPWWRVDLGKDHEIDGLVIWHRTDNQLHTRSNNLIAEILDKDDNVVWSHQFAAATPEPHRIDCSNVPSHIAKILAIESDARSDQQHEAMEKYYLKVASPEAELSAKIKVLQTDIAALKPMTTVPVMEELPKARTTHVQIRGSFNNLGDEVDPGTPETFHPISTSIERAGKPAPSRLDLARWLVDERNPLTARVSVNRYWQRLFGVGLVRTSEDFGAQGDLPTHPKLLDYLATEYMKSGWDNRALLKRIVMSNTYRQQSVVTPEKRERDPDNRWLSRGPRFRVTAEMVRDQALFSSGLLSQKMFGPPVQPPAPELGLRAAFSGNLAWVASKGEDRYRRAIYTQWRRSSPYPSMETFDVSNREVCDLRRISTNTPLQALVTLNDQVYIEAAQALARRMMKAGGSAESMATVGFRNVLIRKPSKAEVDELVLMFQRAKEHFSKDTEAAKALAIDPLNPVDAKTDIVELASWVTVANVLLNLDEVFMKP